ncbi:MAG TPA: phage tail tip lysozyme [Caulobacteraceae bacterium]|jgi:hypothetical protein|nr:phage tail tip lysozyme [Caulobacteraceae bacterium]
MPTIIDALVVTLGLDPKAFEEGSDRAGKSFAKTKRAAVEDGKAIEQAGKTASAFFSKLKVEALGFFAVVVGATSLAKFAKETIDLAANTGRLATNLGVSTEALSLWEGAVRQNGGTTEDAVTSIQSLVGAFEQIQLTGSSPLIPYLQLLHVSLADLNDPTKTLLKLADAFHAMDPRQAMALGTGMGMTPAMITLLEHGRGAVLGVLEAQARAYVIHARDAEAAQRAQQQISLLKDSYRALGAELLTDALPGLTRFADALTQLAQDPATHELLDETERLGSAVGHMVADVMGALSIPTGESGFVKWLTSQVKQATWMVQGLDALAHWTTTPFAQRHKAWQYWQAASMYFQAAGQESAIDWSKTPGAPTSSIPAGADLVSTGVPLGVIAGLYAESGMDPNAVNPTTGAYGIAQWLGPRLTALKAFAAEKGRPVSDMGVQTAFLIKELSDPRYAAILNAPDEGTRASRFIGDFERPGAGYAGDMVRAQRWLAAQRSGGPVSHRHSETHIGTIQVHTPATDGAGVAKDLGQHLAQNGLVVQADTGLQ